MLQTEYKLDKNELLELVSYDVAEERLRPNIDHFLTLLREGENND